MTARTAKQHNHGLASSHRTRLKAPTDDSSSGSENEGGRTEFEFKKPLRITKDKHPTHPHALVAHPTDVSDDDQGTFGDADDDNSISNSHQPRSEAIATQDISDAVLQEMERQRQERVRQSIQHKLEELTSYLEHLRVAAEKTLTSLEESAYTSASLEQQQIVREHGREREEMRRLLESLRAAHDKQAEEAEQRLREYKARVARQQQEKEQAAKRKAEEEQRHREELMQKEALIKAYEKQLQETKLQLERHTRSPPVASATPSPPPTTPPATTTTTPPPPAAATARSPSATPSPTLSSAARGPKPSERLQQLKSQLETSGRGVVFEQLSSGIHLSIQQISSDRQQVLQKLHELQQQLATAQPHSELAYRLFASKLVEQGSVQVRSQPRSAFAFAAVAVGLMAQFSGLVPVLLAHFHEACPYSIPSYGERLPGMSDRDFLLSIGYEKRARSETGVEKEASYFGRMDGIIRLYAAIMQTPSPSRELPNPHGLEFAWAWIAKLLNLPPRRITPTILFAFLNTAAYELLRAFPHQFTKLLHFINDDYIPRIRALPDVDIPALTRLELYLSDFMRKGTLQEPEGRSF